VVTEVELQRVHPPGALLAPCPVPTLTGETNAALLDWALTLRERLEACDADKAALRRWVEGH